MKLLSDLTIIRSLHLSKNDGVNDKIKEFIDRYKPAEYAEFDYEDDMNICDLIIK